MAALRQWSRFSPWPFKASSSDDRQPVKRSARPVIAPVQTLRICFQVKLLAGRVGLNSFYLVLQSLQPPPGAGFLPWRGSQVVRPRSAKPLSPVRFRPAPPTSPENLGLGRGPALRSGFRQQAPARRRRRLAQPAQPPQVPPAVSGFCLPATDSVTEVTTILFLTACRAARIKSRQWEL